MTTIALLALAWIALLIWIAGRLGCQHEQAHGDANYYEESLGVWIHLKTCDDCGESFITHER